MEWKGNVITCCHPVTYVGVCLASSWRWTASQPRCLQSCREHKTSARKLERHVQTMVKHLETESRCWIAEGRGAASRRVLGQEKGRRQGARVFTTDARASLPIVGWVEEPWAEESRLFTVSSGECCCCVGTKHPIHLILCREVLSMVFFLAD